MIKNLSADFIDKIFADYPTLENLNLSHNGKLFYHITLLLEIEVIENLDKFKQTLKVLNVSSNKISNISDKQ